ncbi:hypothetical protein JJB75_14490 [Clostridium perfringens]|uniref:hypothetical protein n=1 Tax=Clostridium perfringens TaxID=1502 RepID=UPI001ABB5F6A|nr:hypothetical protein [Clostridium perfringens]MBO3304362.1 hypothetical protein [Clostridium perfringens]MBO3307683.1 hypothetical protein [Clostridium perfringens]MBO3310999.1 hypothetical protein [Clostridium perfringens]MBO3317316.1 hypothetical protein [Clostridium perfringens]
MEILKLNVATLLVATFFMIEISCLKMVENKIVAKKLEKISFSLLIIYMFFICLYILGFILASNSVERLMNYMEYIHKFYEHIYIFWGLLFIELIYFIKYREFEALKVLILKFVIYFGSVFIIMKC